jgi:hypothetical protein
LLHRPGLLLSTPPPQQHAAAEQQIPIIPRAGTHHISKVLWLRLHKSPLGQFTPFLLGGMGGDLWVVELANTARSMHACLLQCLCQAVTL